MTGRSAPTRGALRVCRGAVLAVTSAVLAITAHVAAGGGPPDTGLTLLLTVGVAAAGVALADRRRSTAAILAVLGAAQVATHVLLSVESPMPMSHVDGRLMLAAHVAAVLVSGLLLARADAALFVFASVLALLLPRLLVAPPVPDGTVAPRPSSRPLERSAMVVSRRSHTRRGPPPGV